MKLKLITCLLLNLLLCLHMMAQNNSSPLNLEISLQNQDENKSCITIVAKLINTSDKKIVIDKNLLWYMVSFKRDGEFKTKVGDFGQGYKGDYLTLLPKQQFGNSRCFEISEKFFIEPGQIKLSTKYGQFIDAIYEDLVVWKGTIDSNEINFK